MLWTAGDPEFNKNVILRLTCKSGIIKTQFGHISIYSRLGLSKRLKQFYSRTRIPSSSYQGHVNIQEVVLDMAWHMAFKAKNFSLLVDKCHFSAEKCDTTSSTKV